MSRINFSHLHTTQPSPEIADLIQRLAPEQYEGPERRREERKSLVAVIPAIIVDEAYLPVGEQFTVVTRNISASGISLFHPTPIEARLIALELPGDDGPPTQVVVKVIHSRPVGHAQEIGGEFVAKLT